MLKFEHPTLHTEQIGPVSHNYSLCMCATLFFLQEYWTPPALVEMNAIMHKATQLRVPAVWWALTAMLISNSGLSVTVCHNVLYAVLWHSGTCAVQAACTCSDMPLWSWPGQLAGLALLGKDAAKHATSLIDRVNEFYIRATGCKPQISRSAMLRK